MFRKKIKLVYQTTSAECGLACLAMVAGYFGLKKPLSFYRKLVNVGRDGINLVTLHTLLEKLDLEPSVYRLDDIYSFKFSNNPYILFTKENHFVVIKAQRDSIDLYDPSSGCQKSSRESIANINGGIIIEVKKTEYFEQSRERISEFRYVKRFFENSFFSFLPVLVLSLFSYIVSISVPQIIEYLITSIIGNISVDWKLVMSWVTVTVMLYFLISYLENFFVLKFQERVGRDINLSIVKHLMELPYSYFDDRGEANILYRMSFIDQFIDLICNKILRGILNFIGVCIFIFYILSRYPSIWIFVALATIILGILVMFFNYYILDKKQEELQLESIFKAQQVEILNSIFNIKSSRMSGYFYDEYKNKFIQYLNKNKNNNKRIYLFNLFISIYTLFMPLVIVLLSIAFIKIKSGEIFFLYAVVGMLLNHSSSFFTNLYEIILLKPSLFYINDILDEEAPMIEGEQVIKDFETLELLNVSFRYNDISGSVLKNVSLKINRGEKVSIVGLSGSGKSSLIKLILGLYDKFDGEIFLNNYPIQEIASSFFSDNIAVVNQSVSIFNKTVKENITLGNANVSEVEIWEALKSVNLDTFIMNLPMKLNTVLSADGENFSGGQVQRLALARAIIKKPQLIILDEATSSLDLINERSFYSSIKKMGISILSISHRMSTVSDSNRIYIIDNGEILDSGTHEELVKQNVLYQKIYLSGGEE